MRSGQLFGLGLRVGSYHGKGDYDLRLSPLRGVKAAPVGPDRFQRHRLVTADEQREDVRQSKAGGNFCTGYARAQHIEFGRNPRNRSRL
ncbi:hypothetical protein D3C75_976250 [compost metagenome]